MGVSWMFKGCFKHVLKKLQGYYKRALKVLERKFQSFKSAPRKVQGCFREVSTICQKCFKELRGCFKEVLFSNFVVAWYSSQLPEQKEGLFYYPPRGDFVNKLELKFWL